MTPPPSNWSLSQDSWLALRNLLADELLSWSRAPFQIAAAQSIPALPGIYAVCASPVVPLSPTDPLLRNLLYIGKASASIRERFVYHLGDKASPRMKAARSLFGPRLEFHWAATSRWPELEPLIYDAFGPPLNEISPPRITGRLGRPRPLLPPAYLPTHAFTTEEEHL